MKPSLLGNSRFSDFWAALLLPMALASAWPNTAQAQLAQQIVLTSPDIQTGTPVALLAFSGSAARRGEPNFDGARACGLNKIRKAIDLSSPQFFAALFNRVQLSAASIASSLQGTVFYQVDLTGIAVDEIVRSGSVATDPTTPDNFLTETITLHATSTKYTYQPVLPNGQKNGPPITFSWNCITNTGS
jgi:type VI protein secretion system component Hcp